VGVCKSEQPVVFYVLFAIKPCKRKVCMLAANKGGTQVKRELTSSLSDEGSSDTIRIQGVMAASCPVAQCSVYLTSRYPHLRVELLKVVMVHQFMFRYQVV